MDEKKHHFPEYKLNFLFLISSIEHNIKYYYIFNDKKYFYRILINDLYLIISSNSIYFYIDSLHGSIFLKFEKSAMVVMDPSFLMYYKTSVSTVFPNISQEQWIDLMEHNYPLMQNMIESYFNELIKLETKTNLEKYENII